MTELNSSGGWGRRSLDGGEGVWVRCCSWKRRGLWGRRERESKDRGGGEDNRRQRKKVKGVSIMELKI